MTSVWLQDALQLGRSVLLLRVSPGEETKQTLEEGCADKRDEVACTQRLLKR